MFSTSSMTTMCSLRLRKCLASRPNVETTVSHLIEIIANHPLPVQRVVVYLLDLSRASVFNVTPIMSLWASRVSRQSGERNVSAF